jgi:protein-S-isoprenylcysteine O-methyltransferase Ste14
MDGSAWRWLVHGVVWACWGIFGLVWAAGAVYNHKHAPAVRTRARTRELWLIVAVGIFLLARVVPVRDWRPLSIGDTWLRLLGLPILLGATAFTLWARAVLGTMWSSTPMAREQHQLRTQGPYGITRHPIYTGILGMLLGTALLSGLGYWAIVVVVAVAAFEVKIHDEEQLMAASFPQDYPAYRRSVPQLIPGLGRLRRQAAG